MDGIADRWGGHAEAVLYVGVAIALVGGAAVLLVDAVRTYVTHLSDGVPIASVELLSTLLLVFVFVELLGAVRSTVRERRLVAEPFLLVGIIAAIKEIVLIGGTERVLTEWAIFRNAMIEIGVLAAVVLALALATWLLRKGRSDLIEAGTDVGRPGPPAPPPEG